MNRVIILSILLLVLFNACNDNNAQITKYTDNQTPIKCLHLVLFPDNKLIADTLGKLYDFDKKCDYELQVSTKGGIVCNSNQNADKKILANFPSGYIRFDLIKGTENIFSYYKDLTHRVTKEDIKEAFESLKKENLH